MARYLIVQRGPEIGKRYDLKGNVITVGRSDDNDMMLDDPYVSRYHAVFKMQGDNLSVVDLGSENPVLIKDTPLEAGTPYILVHRDIVRIGQNVFSYQDSAAAPPRPMVEPEKKVVAPPSSDPAMSAIAPGSLTGETPVIEAPAPVYTPPPPPVPAVEDAGATVVGVNLRDMYSKMTASGTAETSAVSVPANPDTIAPEPPAGQSYDSNHMHTVEEKAIESSSGQTQGSAPIFSPAPTLIPPQADSDATVIGFAPKAPTTHAPSSSSDADMEITYIASPKPKVSEPVSSVVEEQETSPTGTQPVPQEQQPYQYGQYNYGQYQQPSGDQQQYAQYNYGQYQPPYDPNQPQPPADPNQAQPPVDSNQPQYNYGQYGQYQPPADPNQAQSNQYQPPADPNQPPYNYGQYNYGQYQQPYDPNQPQQYGQYQQPYDPNQPQQYGQYQQPPADQNQQYGQYNYGQYQQPYDPNQPQQPIDPNQQPYNYGQYGQYYQQYGQPGQQGYQGYDQYNQANPDSNTVQNAGSNADPTQVADYAAHLKGQQPPKKEEAKKETKPETKTEEYDPDNAPTMVIRIDKTKQ
jgi:FHA domain